MHIVILPDSDILYIIAPGLRREMSANNGSYLYTEAGYYANLAGTLYYLYAVFGILIICMFLAIIINTYLFEKRTKVESASSAVQKSNNTTSRTGPRNSSADVFASLDTNSRTIEAANTSQKTVIRVLEMV